MISRSTPYEDLPDVLTIPEVKAYLGLGRNTVYDQARTGRLHTVRVGRRLLIPKTSLKALLGGNDA